MLNLLPPAELEREVLTWTDAVYEEAETELLNSHETKLTGKLIDYIHGRQWSAKARYGRSRPVVNRMFRQFIEQVGLLTDLELDFQVKFGDQIDGFSEIEKLVNRMIVDWAYLTDFEMELSDVVMWGLIHTGPTKIQWNPRMWNGLGDNEMVPMSPLHFMRVGGGKKLQDAEVCISRDVVTIPELVRRHGDVARSVKPDISLSQYPGQVIRPDRIGRGSWANMNPVLRKMMGHKTDPIPSKYPLVVRKEFWIRDDTVWEGKESIIVGKLLIGGREFIPRWAYRVEPGMLLFPRKRVIVTAGGKVLEDSTSPYWHGMFPFALYKAFRVPWSDNGLSALEPLAQMQAILNRVKGGVMDTVNDAIEPTIMGPKSAFTQQDWDALDPGAHGGKIAYNNNAPRPPDFKAPRQLPNYVSEFTQSVEKEQDMTSGAAAIQQAISKKQVPSGDALDMIFNSRSTNIRLMSRNLKSFLNAAGQLTVSNMLQFYDASRRIATYGTEGIVSNDLVPVYGHMLPKGMQPEEFVRKATFTIRRGSLLNIEKAEKVQLAFALRKMKDISRHGLLRFLDANIDIDKNDKEIMEEKRQELMLAAAVGAMAGKGQKHH